MSWDERLARWFAVVLPNRLSRNLPGVSDVFFDGTWTLRYPKLAALGPPMALVAGALVPFLWLRQEVAFTQSLPFMATALVLGTLSGPIGLAFVSGFIASDVIFGESLNYRGPGEFLNPLMRVLARVVPYLLLSLLAIVIPPTARRLVGRDRTKWTDAMRVGLVLAALVFLWSQATIVLIRPAFIWLVENPPVQAIATVQFGWPWLAGVALLAGAARVRFEGTAMGSIPALQHASIDIERWRRQPRMSLRKRLPIGGQIAVTAAGVILLLAGTFTHVVDAVVAGLVVALLEAWRLGLLAPRTRGPLQRIRRGPALVRAAITVAVGFALAWWLAAAFWPANTLRLTALGALVTLALGYLLLVPFEPKVGAK
jgi:hypothetical protein